MRRTRGDEGFTLVETVVAMLVFAIISTGVVASTITISRMSADNRSRIVATNLAAQTTDAARLAGDPFALSSGTSTQTVSGRVYTIAQTAAWVDAAGADATCGAATSLQYKRISVQVTWQNMAVTTQPVRTDTLIATTTKVTDASSGAILVSVEDSTGAGESGVSVSIRPKSGTGGGTALPSQPDATDSEGCSYATTVAPGAYTVTLGASGYLDAQQVSAPVKTVSVTAGSTTPVAFQYDAAVAYTIGHAANASSFSPPSTPLLPTNLTTTLVPVATASTVYPVLVPNTGTSASAYPTQSGYAAVAGELTSATGTTLCASFDPGAWPAGTSGTTRLAAGSRGTAPAVSPGVPATVNDKMGLVTVKATAAGSLVATPNNPTTAVTGGNPGCDGNASATPLTFGAVLKNGTITVALPYGAWTLSSTSPSTVLTSATPISNAVGGSTAVPAAGTSSRTVAVTLDPRVAS